MKIMCNWYHLPRQIGEKEPMDDYRITHGICADCRSRVLEEIAELREIAPDMGKQIIERMEG